MSTLIQSMRPDAHEASELILELDALLMPLYPVEDRHGYSIDKLIDQQVDFFVVYHNGKPAGCGGIQLYRDAEPPYGELKRMYVRNSFRGLGLAKQILHRLEKHAAAEGIKRVRLETGIYQTEAIGIYERCGYGTVGPFGDYTESALSVFYEKTVELTED